MSPVIQDSNNYDQRFEGLEKLLTSGFSRVEMLLTSFDARLRCLEQGQASGQANQANFITNRAETIERQKATDKTIIDRITILEDFMKLALPWVSATKWFAGVLGLQIIVIVIALITGVLKFA